MWSLWQTPEVTVKIASIQEEQGHSICNREVHTVSKTASEVLLGPARDRAHNHWMSIGLVTRNANRSRILSELSSHEFD